MGVFSVEKEGLMITNIDRAKLLRLVEDEDAQVIDVLPEQEYSSAHTLSVLFNARKCRACATIC